jgi:predicted metal-dependent hydrolase
LKVKSEKLKVISEEVKLHGGFLEVYTNDKSKVKDLVEEWYKSKAKDKLHLIAGYLFEEFVKKYNLSLFTFHFSLRNMPTRWGSCTPKGKIILNPELIKAPKGCIEYVIIHELCHLVHHDHTQKFIDLQTKEMKDWEKWKMKLEKLLA